MSKLSPMLATAVKDTNEINFPVFASPKLDGVRAVIIKGVVMSRSLKPIPNAHVQDLFGKPEFNGLDGELIVGSPYDKNAFNNTSGAVMSKKGEPDVTFYVFDDMTNPDEDFVLRLRRAKERLSPSLTPVIGGKCVLVSHISVNNVRELDEMEEEWLAIGYEGVMLRQPDSPYKFGRSTLNEGYLLKLKRFADSEAEIIGFIEQQHNTNEATRDELGNIKRSSAKAGLVGKNTLGALQVRDITSGVEFEIGTGLDDEQRAEIWNNQARYLGTLAKYKYFPSGSKDKPRFPVFQGIRDLLDI